MTMRDKPPFRADHVSSLLRPARLLEAREKFLGPQTADQNLGPHDNADLKAVEDDCIREVVAMQQEVGLSAATDVEFRRRSWWLEMAMNWDGFEATRQGKESPFGWKNNSGKQQDFSVLSVTGKIGWNPSPVVEAFKFLAATTTVIGGDPPAGSGFWWLIRAVACDAASYDSGTGSQIASRDAGIDAAPAACP